MSYAHAHAVPRVDVTHNVVIKNRDEYEIQTLRSFSVTSARSADFERASDNAFAEASAPPKVNTPTQQLLKDLYVAKPLTDDELMQHCFQIQLAHQAECAGHFHIINQIQVAHQQLTRETLMLQQTIYEQRERIMNMTPVAVAELQVFDAGGIDSGVAGRAETQFDHSEQPEQPHSSTTSAAQVTTRGRLQP